MDLVTGSGPCPFRELSELLHRRLRVAVLLPLAALAYLLVRQLVEPPLPSPTAWDVVLHAAATATLGVAAALLWSGRVLCLTSLRVLELVVFGTVALFFGYLQYLTLHRGDVFAAARPGQEAQVLRLALGICSLRWFALLVVHGVFIPNGWRRSAVVVSALALTPLALTLAVGLADGTLAVLVPGLVDMVFIMGVGAAIAVFGSYKIEGLRQEAFQARQLGQYRLKKLLGAGGMGEVYLAEHLLLRRPCALKLVRPEQADNPGTLSRFEREVQATAALTHWNTVEIFDYGHTTDGTFYYVMEYLPGLSLEDLVERHGPLPPERVIHFLRQVCAGLREAHRVGLIHRDIKPSNVIACERGGVHDVAKVVDFGLVQSPGVEHQDKKLTVQGTILGSPPYMSPEQAAGKQNLDATTDVYSLGAVAYFLLTGQPPFVRETAMQMLLAHAYEPVVPLAELRPDVPHDLQAVILRCLEKDPAKRFPNVASLDRALAECSSAGRWTEERAEEWWREHGGEGPAPKPAWQTPYEKATVPLPETAAVAGP